MQLQTDKKRRYLRQQITTNTNLFTQEDYNMNVFDINNAIEELEQKDLDPEVLVDTIESLKLTRDQKLDGAAGLSDKYNSQIKWAKERMTELREFIKVLTNKKNRLNQFITDAMDDAGLKELQTEHHILKPRNYRDSVIVEEVKKLPIDYVVEEKTIKADKKKLYEDLKAGKEITGAHLKANRKTLIK
jgi:hypothetical protein